MVFAPVVLPAYVVADGTNRDGLSTTNRPFPQRVQRLPQLVLARTGRENVAEFPESSNVYDSLGEAFAAAGKKDLAIENYEKSIKLDPKNQNGIDRLKKLKDQE